jgi:NAD(P)-dependent dehydrogenase (short-subunit alcohol dehydrogenase family)
MDLGLKGKVAFVTGAGGGLGKTIALTFAQEGADVAVAELDASRAEGTVDEIKTLGSRAIAVTGNVVKKEEVDQMIKKTIGELGKIDILVNTVGASAFTGVGMPKDFSAMSEEDWKKDVDFCFFAAVNCTGAVINHMKERKYGKIVSILSDAYLGRDRRFSIYGAAKAATATFSKTLALEVAWDGINVNCVSPAATHTLTTEMIWNPAMAQTKEKMMKSYPLAKARGDLGRPEDIADAVVFLCSDRASWITGQVLSVSGGYS